MRYILSYEGGDQLCGRAATGLPLTDAEFAILPPHLNISEGSILTLNQWNQILPGYSSYYLESFRPVIPFLLASLVYHKRFLEENLLLIIDFFIQEFGPAVFWIL